MKAKTNEQRVSAAANTAAKDMRTAGCELKNERKSLTATVKLLIDGNSAAAEKFRTQLGLRKGATNAERKIAANKIMDYLPSVLVYKYYNVQGVLTGVRKVPCTARGNINVDTLNELQKAVVNLAAKSAAITEARIKCNGAKINEEELSATARKALAFKQVIFATVEVYK